MERHRPHSEPAVTLKKVALSAGVHASTAAVVINGARSSTVVSAVTRQRVLDAADRLGYRPNRAAQALRRQRTMTVGLSAGPVRNPFFAEMATLLEGFLLDAGYEVVVVMDAGRYRDDKALLETLCARGVDGIIVWSERDTEGRRMVEGGVGCPVVIFGYPSPHVDSVTTDFGLGARLAANHLLETGRRRIGYFCPSESLTLWSGNLRMRNFCDTVTANGAMPAAFPYESTLGDIGRARSAAEVIGRSPERPDGLLCFNDLVAIGAMMGLRRAGLRIPEDVAVIGFDDIPLAAQLDIPLSTVDLPLEDVCRTAVDLLLSRLGGDLHGPPKNVVIEPRLIIRASSLAAAHPPQG
jgi:LacI family transcriptional regulator